MTRRVAVEGRMRRGLGTSEQARLHLNAHNAKQTDWHGHCQVCRTHFTGSIAELSEPCPHCGAGGDHGTPSR